MTMREIRRILCPTDFSECSDASFQFAVDLARTFGASVHLVHVHELRAYSMPDGALLFADPSLLARVNEELSQALAKRAEGVGVSVTTQLVEGVPHREIVRLAADLPAELIVIGTHGRSGVTRYLIGSVAE